MIGGIVENPVAMKVKDMENEAYKRIEELKEIINRQNESQEKKCERINLLEDLKQRIESYEDEARNINEILEQYKNGKNKRLL